MRFPTTLLDADRVEMQLTTHHLHVRKPPHFVTQKCYLCAYGGVVQHNAVIPTLSEKGTKNDGSALTRWLRYGSNEQDDVTEGELHGKSGACIK